MIIDIDYQMNVNGPNVRLFCKDSVGRSVIINAFGFFPYFYVEDIPEAHEIKQRDEIASWTKRIEPRSMRLYEGGKEVSTLKLYGNEPSRVPEISSSFLKSSVRVFEADIPFIKRFLIDANLRCLQGVHVAGKEEAGSHETSYTITSHFAQLKPISQENYQPQLLAIDIEVAAEDESVQQLLEKGEKRLTAISITFGKTREGLTTEAKILLEDSDEAERDLVEWLFRHFLTLAPDVVITF
ncbi:MAG TPA: 3'-5' exonuclease, partial [Candidatus Hodarchaeales archaeon]|nr:3'-5' exonuclease [Candidatus Hodarchaeales archaeon]